MKSLKPYNWNKKKVIITLIILLVCCDVTLLFAAQSGLDNSIQQQTQLQQIKRLQQQVQQQPVSQPVSAASSTPPQGKLTETSASNPNVLTGANPVAQSLTSVATQQSPVINSQSGPLANWPNALNQPSSPSQTTTQQPVQIQNDTTVSSQDINNAAFNAVTQNALPMTPDQIQKLKQLFNQTQFAAAANTGIPPKPIANSQLVSLAPGSTPPVIRLAQGFVSSLVFIDSTGAPWPIESYDIGNPSAFNIQWNKKDNTLMIQAVTLYTYGNLAVRLQGLNTPVMLTLVPGQKAIDYRVDLRVQGYGPNAKPTFNGLPNSANPDLMSILDGVPPTGSTALRVSGGSAEAWLNGDKMYVRTRFTILSPGWIANMSSADGMKAYEMPKSPLLLVSQNGKILQVKVEGL